MGKVTVFCVISGGVPEIEDSGKYCYDNWDEVPEGLDPNISENDELSQEPPADDSPTLPRIRKVFREKIITRDELDGIEDLSVIGPIGDDGETLYDETDTEDTSVIPDEVVRVVSGCRMGDYWDFGSVDNPMGKINLVSYGVNMLAQTTSLSILEAASEGRVTALRLWRWGMSMGQHRGFAMEKYIDYGGPDLEQFPNPFPGLEPHGFINIESKSEEDIYTELVFRGRFWVWMRPDRFPVIRSERGATANVEILTGAGPTSASTATSFESLPIEMLTLLAKELDLQSFLALTQTSRVVRSLLMKPIILDALAREQLWTRPGRGPASKSEQDWWESQVKKLEEQDPEEAGPGFDWHYLKRCHSNPSMKNRRRIWGCVQQIERCIIEFESKRDDSSSTV